MILDTSGLQNAATVESAIVNLESGPAHGLRFVLCYLGLYTLPFPIANMPFTDDLHELFHDMASHRCLVRGACTAPATTPHGLFQLQSAV
jgi:hypothetical protein